MDKFIRSPLWFFLCLLVVISSYFIIKNIQLSTKNDRDKIKELQVGYDSLQVLLNKKLVTIEEITERERIKDSITKSIIIPVKPVLNVTTIRRDLDADSLGALLWARLHKTYN